MHVAGMPMQCTIEQLRRTRRSSTQQSHPAPDSLDPSRPLSLVPVCALVMVVMAFR